MFHRTYHLTAWLTTLCSSSRLRAEHCAVDSGLFMWTSVDRFYLGMVIRRPLVQHIQVTSLALLEMKQNGKCSQNILAQRWNSCCIKILAYAVAGETDIHYFHREKGSAGAMWHQTCLQAELGRMTSVLPTFTVCWQWRQVWFWKMKPKWCIHVSHFIKQYLKRKSLKWHPSVFFLQC